MIVVIRNKLPRTLIFIFLAFPVVSGVPSGMVLMSADAMTLQLNQVLENTKQKSTVMAIATEIQFIGRAVVSLVVGVPPRTPSDSSCPGDDSRPHRIVDSSCR